MSIADRVREYVKSVRSGKPTRDLQIPAFSGWWSLTLSQEELKKLSSSPTSFWSEDILANVSDEDIEALYARFCVETFDN